MNLARLKLSLVLALTFANLTHAGDRIGDGGDVLRLRSAIATRQLVALGEAYDEVRTKSGCAGAQALLEKHANLYHYLLKDPTSIIEVLWSDDASLSQCVTTTREPGAEYFTVRFSYHRCPRDLTFADLQRMMLDIQVRSGPTEVQGQDAFVLISALSAELRKPGCDLLKPIRGEEGTARNPNFFTEEHVTRQRYAIQDHLYKHFKNYDARPADWDRKMLELGFDGYMILPEHVYQAIEVWKILFDPTLASCSKTGAFFGAPISFSLVKCANVRDDAELEWLFLHETAHQLGIDDEWLADRFADGFWFR